MERDEPALHLKEEVAALTEEVVMMMEALAGHLPMINLATDFLHRALN
jgi:hypothetical protein